MIEYFRVAGELIYHREYGLPVPSNLNDRFRAARRAVVQGNYYRA